MSGIHSSRITWLTSIFIFCGVMGAQFLLFRNKTWSIEPYFDEMWRIDGVNSPGGLFRYTIGAPISPYWIAGFSLLPDALSDFAQLRLLNLALTSIGVFLLAFPQEPPKFGPQLSHQLVRTTFAGTVTVAMLISPSLRDISSYFNNYGTEVFLVGLSKYLLLGYATKDTHSPKSELFFYGVLVLAALMTQGAIPVIFAFALIFTYLRIKDENALNVRSFLAPVLVAFFAIIQLWTLKSVNYTSSLSGLSGFWSETSISRDAPLSSLWILVRSLPESFFPEYMWSSRDWRLQLIIFATAGVILMIALLTSPSIRVLLISLSISISITGLASAVLKSPFLVTRVTVASYILFPSIFAHAIMTVLGKIRVRDASIILLSVTAIFLLSLKSPIENLSNSFRDSPDTFARGLIADTKKTLAEVNLLPGNEPQFTIWVSYHPMSHWYVRYALETKANDLIWENWDSSNFYGAGISSVEKITKADTVVCVIPWETGPEGFQNACLLDKSHDLIKTVGGRRAEFRIWKKSK